MYVARFDLVYLMEGRLDFSEAKPHVVKSTDHELLALGRMARARSRINYSIRGSHIGDFVLEFRDVITRPRSATAAKARRAEPSQDYPFYGSIKDEKLRARATPF